MSGLNPMLSMLWPKRLSKRTLIFAAMMVAGSLHGGMRERPVAIKGAARV